MVNHLITPEPEVCTSLPAWTCPALLSAPAPCPAMEFSKVPLLKGVSQRGKILFTAANCSDSPELPAHGLTGPDGPAGPSTNLSSGAGSWMSRKSTGLYRSDSLSPFVPIQAENWINTAKEALGVPGGLVPSGDTAGQSQSQPLHSPAASSSSCSAQPGGSSVSMCPGTSAQTLLSISPQNEKEMGISIVL